MQGKVVKLSLIQEQSADKFNVEEPTPDNPWCQECFENDCIIDMDGTCAMIRIYHKAIKKSAVYKDVAIPVDCK